jgi:phage replication-related protein YjqB (UPF0714/DUF867 family)
MKEFIHTAARRRGRGYQYLANICNLRGRGMGVQQEISRGLRSEMFRDLSLEERQHPTAKLYRFTQAIREAIKLFAAVFLEPESLEPTD